MDDHPRMTRDEILGRFETLLDASLASEEPPGGIEAELLSIVRNHDESEDTRDSYQLWAALTALTQEIKLQGRAFRDLSETVGSQAGRIAEELSAVYRERERDAQRETERRSRREILGALIDMRDRLRRGLESARASNAVTPKAGWKDRLARLLKTPADESVSAAGTALMKGYELGLERLDQLLEDFDAREISCEGQPFDPRRMNAVEVEESGTVPEGTVLEVYRSGYEWNGEVFRTAQVKVSRAPGG